MQATLTDPDVAEELSINYSNDYALSGEWKFDELHEPEDDLAAFFEDLPGNRILDVGCGWARYVYRFLDQDLTYIGIDHSPKMIAIARETHPDQKFELMSYRKLTFPDASFDGLWCCCAFSGEPKHNMPTVLEGLKRVLVPGGIMTVVMPAMYESHERMLCDKSGEPLLYHAHYELHELAHLLEEAGFATITTTQHWHEGAMSVLVKNEEIAPNLPPHEKPHARSSRGFLFSTHYMHLLIFLKNLGIYRCKVQTGKEDLQCSNN